MNIGGGLGVKYTSNDVPPSVEELADAVTKSMKKYSVDIPTIYIEPGRSIISTSGVTLYTVGSSKQVPNGRKYVAVDGGMADNPRPSMYQAEYVAEVANKIANALEYDIKKKSEFIYKTMLINLVNPQFIRNIYK